MPPALLLLLLAGAGAAATCEYRPEGGGWAQEGQGRVIDSPEGHSLWGEGGISWESCSPSLHPSSQSIHSLPNDELNSGVIPIPAHTNHRFPCPNLSQVSHGHEHLVRAQAPRGGWDSIWRGPRGSFPRRPVMRFQQAAAWVGMGSYFRPVRGASCLPERTLFRLGIKTVRPLTQCGIPAHHLYVLQGL